jgi:hypothetical protein
MAANTTRTYYCVVIIDKDSEQLEGYSEYLTNSESEAAGVAKYIQEKRSQEIRATNKKIAIFKCGKNQQTLVSWFGFQS